MKELDDYKELEEYLAQLSESSKPFNCPNLRILSEDLKVTNVDLTEGYLYKKSTLICCLPKGSWETHECKLKGSEISLNEQGELEILCAKNHGKFKLKIIDFKAS